jgi:hypothetical protein
MMVRLRADLTFWLAGCSDLKTPQRVRVAQIQVINMTRSLLHYLFLGFRSVQSEVTYRKLWCGERG